MDEWIKVPVSDNILPIVSECGHLIVDGIIDGEYAYVPANVLNSEHFAFAHVALQAYPIVESVEYPEVDQP